MLLRFSVALHGGLEILQHETPQYQEGSFHVNEDLFAGFMEALQLMSEEIGTPIREINLASFVLYVRTYGNFTIRLLVTERLPEDRVTPFFEVAAKKMYEILPRVDINRVLSQATVKEHFLPLLASLVPLHGPAPVKFTSPFAPGASPPAVSKLCVAGLANAGKTTIKNVFFENWDRAQVRAVAPTLGVEVTKKFLDFLEDHLKVWDLGGQTRFRAQHLAQKHLWYDLSALVYVVDLQDPAYFAEAKTYLDAVWRLVRETNDRLPPLAIFLHKYDPGERASLTRHVSQCLAHFRAYAPIASFHLTSVENDTSNVALVKTLYFSLPAVMIKKLLEEGFMQNYTEELLPRFALLARGRSALPASLTREIHASSLTWGRSFGASLQGAWLEYLRGEVSPRVRNLSGSTLQVEKRGPALRVRVPLEEEDRCPTVLQKTILDGILTGIARTFHLAPPRVVEEKPAVVTWAINVAKTPEALVSQALADANTGANADADVGGDPRTAPGPAKTGPSTKPGKEA